ncbi:DUF1028 domain-containing protein [Bosea sp. 117]|uniref:DUF1028 domain-containing protein n=1 Tax=Bosea sp. 117 TaxID=1125973 RepID=UPI000494964E|nr:DUF1028 domain-containing protein [Bosea sp. 117]
MLKLNTFSIVARCPRTGNLGVAVATAVPAVGATCPHTRAGVGAASTQSWINPYLAMDVLDAIASGLDAETALARIIACDPAKEVRQIGVVDASGIAAAWSGDQCTPWYGQHVGPGYAVQGNMLTGPETLEAMVAAFEGSEGEALDERLIRALEAGDAHGGDKRGKQSAALRVQAEEAYLLVDLRADEHPSPVQELRRILEIARLQLIPFIAGMPKRREAAGRSPPEVERLLALSPPDRPGGGGAYSG